MEYVSLNNGVEVPILGFGVYLVPESRCQATVEDAIDAGYRHIDTAQYYRNEAGVGAAVAASGLPREDFFITTKTYNSTYSTTSRSIDESLRKLGTDYVDLMLIHWPSGDIRDTYRALEDAYAEGKAKAIGISNFYADDIEQLSDVWNIVPAVNQVETHVFYQQRRLRPLLDAHGIALESWSPLAQGKNNLFSHPVLTAIGEKHGKTPAQIALRFLTQSGIIAIPKSSNSKRMRDNIDIFDITLDSEDLARIAEIDEDRTLFGWP